MSSRLLYVKRKPPPEKRVFPPRTALGHLSKSSTRVLLSCRQSRRQSGIARADHDHVVNLFCHTYSTSSLTLAVTGINLKGS